jgi:hypothetical protein
MIERIVATGKCIHWRRLLDVVIMYTTTMINKKAAGSDAIGMSFPANPPLKD